MLKACCCSTLRTGAIITGSYSLFSSAIFLVLSTCYLADKKDIQEARTPEEELEARTPEKELEANILYVSAILLAVSTSLRFIMSTILIYGALTSTKWALLPWLFFDALFLGLAALLGIVYVFLLHWEFLLIGIATVPAWYLWAVVLGFYWELRNSDSGVQQNSKNNKLPTTATVSLKRI